jgi:GNAT superfamily N-acetyltransferase
MNIERIQHVNAATSSELVALLTEAFGEEASHLKAQLLHNASFGAGKFTIFAAREGSQLLGINGFIHHSASLSGDHATLFQSVSTATSPKARGRGVFQKLIGSACEEFAATRGLIIGWPNKNSEPIFVNKLGFHRFVRHRVTIPGALLRGCGKQLQLIDRPTATINGGELRRWKATRYGGEIVGEDTCWGRVTFKQYGPLKIKVLNVGAIDDGALVELDHIQRHSGARLVRMVINEDSPIYAGSVWRRGPSVVTEPFIVKPLQRDLEGVYVNAMWGAHDTF